MTTPTGGRIVAFCCENSGMPAMEELLAGDGSAARKVRFVRVPCAGKVDELYVMRALERGAEAVMVLACHTDSCQYLRGNIRAEKRLQRLGDLIEEIGLDRGRLRFANLAANEAAHLEALLGETLDDLEQRDEAVRT